MCRSGQCPSNSTENQSETESKALRLHLRGEDKNDDLLLLERMEKALEKSSKGERFQVKDFGKEDGISKSANGALSTKNVVYQLRTQDIRVALATFPEFFCRGLATEEKGLGLTKADDFGLTNEGFDDRRRKLHSECKGLALWYIREYGL